MQTGLSYFCFIAVLILVLVRLLYSYGLTASFSKTVPHLDLTFTSGEVREAALIDRITKVYTDNWDLKSISAYHKFVKTLKIQNQPRLREQSILEPSSIEVIGIDLTKYPFVIPLELSTSLNNSGYANPYTVKELLWEMMKEDNYVVVNKAMANLFIPRSMNLEDTTVQDFDISDGITDRFLGKVRIIAVLDDFQDTPRMITSLPTAWKISGSESYSGIYIKMKRENEIEEVQRVSAGKIKSVLGKTTVNIENWKEGESRQQKLFSIFNAIFWLIIIAILLLSTFGGILGIYRNFVVKRHALIIFQNLGMSEFQLFKILTGICLLSLLSGLILAFLTLWGFENLFFSLLLKPLQSIVPVASLTVDWPLIMAWGAGMFVGYFLIFLLFLWIIINNKKQLQV